MDAPTNASIDALFASARSARIVTVEPRARQLAEIEADDLPALRAALQIREGGGDFQCMCLGTLAVELRARFTEIGRLTYHHGQSLRVTSWRSDAWLEDGPALLELLAARGVPEPLRQFEREREEAREHEAARARWEEAVPAALRDRLSALEVGPMGLPARPSAAELSDALDALGVARDPIATVRTLFTWLAAGAGPYSGYASYEELPMQLLRALPHGHVIAALDEALDDREIAAAARHFASHEIVTFAKRALAEVPEPFFARARPIVRASGVEDDLVRFDHAVRTAERARAARSPRPPYPIGERCAVLGESLDGPLTNLAAIGDALFSCDVRTIVRFDPGSVVPVALHAAAEPYVVVAAGDRPWIATMNEGEIVSLDGDRLVRIASKQSVPVELVACGPHAAWLNRDEPGGRVIHVSSGARIPVAAGAWSLAIDGEHAYWLESGWNAEGELCRAKLDGSAIERVARVPLVGPSMASPRLVVRNGEVLLALPDGVLAIDHKGVRRVLSSRSPVRAIAADAKHLALLVGRPRDEDSPWTIAVLERDGLRTIATFERAPYHRHPLVVARGLACTLSGDRVIGASL